MGSNERLIRVLENFAS